MCMYKTEFISMRSHDLSKMFRSYSTLSGLALMTQDSPREGRGLHRDSLKLSHMARAWSQILQLVCDYSNACKLHKLANLILSRGFSAGAESVLIMQFHEHLCFLLRFKLPSDTPITCWLVLALQPQSVRASAKRYDPNRMHPAKASEGYTTIIFPCK